MQTTHKISGDAAGGFAAYLTESTGRGDYYVGGEADAETGRWQGSSKALGALGLKPGAAVERDALVALMHGRHPRTGAEVRPVGGDGSRVAGVDLTVGSPKSVSIVGVAPGPAPGDCELAEPGDLLAALPFWRTLAQVAVPRAMTAAVCRRTGAPCSVGANRLCSPASNRLR
jgi:TrwC relaxase